jgi:membrane-associated protease RseP (regulator of RpoE activity)
VKHPFTKASNKTIPDTSHAHVKHAATKEYKKTIGDTEYGIGLFPLGGYVKIAGMVDESLDQLEGRQQVDGQRFLPVRVVDLAELRGGGIAIQFRRYQ